MWWLAAQAAVAVYGAVKAKNSASSSNANQQAWNEYNAEVQYSVDVSNIKAQTAITQLNSMMTLEFAGLNAETNTALIEYNTEVISDTALYNDLLYEKDLADMWSQAGLDIQLIGNQRAKERGTMEATIAASGVTMGVGSAADVLVDQRTQEALDKFIVKTGANIQASNIQNARVQSLWKADQEIKKIQYEGRITNSANLTEASIRSTAIATENEISTIAGMTSADIRRQSGITSAQNIAESNKVKIDNDFAAGMFGAAANAAGGMASRAAQKPTTPTILAGIYKIKK